VCIRIHVQFGITPLVDNDPRDKYLYEITVATGMRKNAGTDSTVYYNVICNVMALYNMS